MNNWKECEVKFKYEYKVKNYEYELKFIYEGNECMKNEWMYVYINVNYDCITNILNKIYWCIISKNMR